MTNGQEYVVPCPHCGTLEGTQYVDLRESSGMVAVMCWRV